MNSSGANTKNLTKAQEIFKNSKPEYKDLIRDILTVEREVMHLRKRTDIHTKIYQYIRQEIK